MPTATTPRKPRATKPAALKRDRWLKVRVTEMEEQAAQVRAKAAGMTCSDYVRLQACGSAPTGVARRAREAGRQRRVEREAPGDRAAVEERLRRDQPGLTSIAIKRLAARELARG